MASTYSALVGAGVREISRDLVGGEIGKNCSNLNPRIHDLDNRYLENFEPLKDDITRF